MWGLDELKKTRAYQEARQAGREKAQEEILTKMIPKLLRRGMTIGEIADVFELALETIQAFAPENPSN